VTSELKKNYIMKNNYFLLPLLTLLVLIPGIFVCGQTKSDISKVWVSDQGDGTYKNPVLHAGYSDPDVVRARDRYYMVSSSFNCVPGIPVLQSSDLVNWHLISHALKRLSPEEVFSQPQHGKGVWIGAKFGFFALRDGFINDSGTANIDWVRVE
jgi:hypothetical protein